MEGSDESSVAQFRGIAERMRGSVTLDEPVPTTGRRCHYSNHGQCRTRPVVTPVGRCRTCAIDPPFGIDHPIAATVGVDRHSPHGPEIDVGEDGSGKKI
jgi:hypothetical protein